MKIITYCVTALLLFGFTALAHDESDKPPFIGMTKAQAFARYGEPKQRTSTDEGEQWTYVLNLGQFIGRHMIPFFVSTQGLRTGVLIFGRDGRVKKFRWDVLQ